MNETENDKAKKKLLKQKLKSNNNNKSNVNLFCCFKFISTFFGKTKEWMRIRNRPLRVPVPGKNEGRYLEFLKIKKINIR